MWFRSAYQLGLTVDGYGDGLLIAIARPKTAKSAHGGGIGGDHDLRTGRRGVRPPARALDRLVDSDLRDHRDTALVVEVTIGNHGKPAS